MKCNYVIYTTDDKYDVGGCCVPASHGFEIEIDDNDCIDINSLNGYGDFSYEISKIDNICQFKKFIQNLINKFEVEELKELIY